MPLTAEEKAERRFQRMLEKSREYSPARYLRKYVAPNFQLMIRAEAGAKEDKVYCITDIGPRVFYDWRGECRCITCGASGGWKGSWFGGGNIETGHFIQGRGAATLLEETNANCQCKICNHHHHGRLDRYEQWMRHVQGQDEIDRLRALKNGPAKQWDREELVRLRINYLDRIKKATQIIEGTAPCSSTKDDG